MELFYGQLPFVGHALLDTGCNSGLNLALYCCGGTGYAFVAWHKAFKQRIGKPAYQKVGMYMCICHYSLSRSLLPLYF
jgi:hypothetical protein